MRLKFRHFQRHFLTKCTIMRLLLYPLVICIITANFCQGQPVVMYPGDTNNDGTANHFDLLPIGIAYGSVGPPRFPASLVWVPQQAEPWPQTLPVSQINLAFVDCNGMDTINSLDVVAIGLNYDSVQGPPAFPPPSPYQPKLTDTCFSCPKPDIAITFNKDVVDVTGELEAYIRLVYPPGVPSSLGALGIAFDVEYHYTNEIIDSLTHVFPDQFPANRMYVAATHTNVLATGSLPPPGRIGFAAAGRGQNVFFSTDTLLTVEFIITDMIIRDDAADTFSLNISNILILNRLEQVICMGNIIRDSVIIVSAKAPPASGPFVRILPNPVGDILIVESPESLVEKVEIYGLNGACVLQEMASEQNRIELPVGALSPGLWLVVVQTKSGVFTSKFLK